LGRIWAGFVLVLGLFCAHFYFFKKKNKKIFETFAFGTKLTNLNINPKYLLKKIQIQRQTNNHITQSKSLLIQTQKITNPNK
jgi:hypothetical protein